LKIIANFCLEIGNNGEEIQCMLGEDTRGCEGKMRERARERERERGREERGERRKEREREREGERERVTETETSRRGTDSCL